MKISGIYKIVNKIDGKYYVGSSNDITSNVGRWYEHRYMLRHKTHHNDHFQNAWYKYGENNFEFIVVERCSSDRKTLLLVEQKYLDIAKSEPEKTYNKSFIADALDMNPEICRKISLSKKGKYKGRDNPNYIETPTDILPKAKEIWIDRGRTEMERYVRSQGYKWGMVERFITLFKSDKDAMRKRKMNFSRLHKRFSHHISDPTIYSLINSSTKDFFSGTRKEFRTKYPKDKNIHRVISGTSRQYKGWELVSSKTI